MAEKKKSKVKKKISSGVAHIVTGESMLTVDDSVTITVEEGKKVIPDIFNVFDTPERFKN